MIFIGDIHGRFTYYLELIKNITHCPTIQVGDFGLGFGRYNEPIKIEGNHWFIRGNHDNPDFCRRHPNYLGDYGYRKDLDVFFVSGAYSIDKACRIEGSTWWREEEITYREFQKKVIPLYLKIRPKIVVTHDAPISVLTEMFPIQNFANYRTNQALQVMFDGWQPDMWVFGHHHINKQVRMNGTLFVCLRELETFEYEREQK